MKTFILLSVCLLSILITLSCSSDDGDDKKPEVVITNPDNENRDFACEEGKVTRFIEKEGIVVIEVESIAETGSWNFSTAIEGFSGSGYFINGTDFLSNPGNGILTYSITITNPGTYRFLWRSRITSGNSNTDLNDNWLRIPDAKHFYGKKNNTIVYPNDTDLLPLPPSPGETVIPLQGTSKDGWFKIYMNSLNDWRWKSCTSDNDPHFIYAVFETAGNYTVQISARSKGHAIDKFVLFKENLNEAQVTSETIAISQINCE